MGRGGGYKGCMLALVLHQAEFPALLGAGSCRELGSTWVSLQLDEDPGVSDAWGSFGVLLQCPMLPAAPQTPQPGGDRAAGNGEGIEEGGKVGRPQERHRKGWCLSQHEALGPFIHPSQQPSSCPDLVSDTEDSGAKAIW